MELLVLITFRWFIVYYRVTAWALVLGQGATKAIKIWGLDLGQGVIKARLTAWGLVLGQGAIKARLTTWGLVLGQSVVMIIKTWGLDLGQVIIIKISKYLWFDETFSINYHDFLVLLKKNSNFLFLSSQKPKKG